MSTVVKIKEIVCSLYSVMRRIALSLVIILAFLSMHSCLLNENEVFSERVKISLREVGNQLLLAHKDSTSLVLPIIEISSDTYELSFKKQLAFEPNTLVSKIEDNFKKRGFSDNYIVEVTQCVDDEVAYSYEIHAEEEKTIIPCSGRFLPEACYVIQIKFIDTKEFLLSKKTIFYILAFLGLILFGLLFYNGKRKKISNMETEYAKLGSFQFYPDQNKLVKQAEEIKLSVKECELLSIFISKPNEVIKRDELTKRVWEDHGVIVGRSLDTYISKLRKILKDDTSIKLTNVHGVGYKLEINTN